MGELENTKKIINLATELSRGIETTREDILARAGRARLEYMEKDLQERMSNGVYDKVPESEAMLQMQIIGALDSTCRRMESPIPDAEYDYIHELINTLDKDRHSKKRLPVSPGILIWRGELEIRNQNYKKSQKYFVQACKTLKLLLQEEEVGVAETLVTALCEGAYATVMGGNLSRSIEMVDNAVSIAREHKQSESIFNRFMREYYVAGQNITVPLASAYLMECDVRINSGDKWKDSEISSEMEYYWNKLNDEFAGLSAIQVPHLMAILSDRNWMSTRPDLATPISRALYLKTADNIPDSLWRKANLLFGGLRLIDNIHSEELKTNTSRAAGFVILTLVTGALTLFSQDALSYHNITTNVSQFLSSIDVKTFLNDLNINHPEINLSGQDLLNAISPLNVQELNVSAIQNMLLLDGSTITPDMIMASGGSSGVVSTLV